MRTKTVLSLLVALLTALGGGTAIARRDPPPLSYARYEKKLPSDYIREAKNENPTPPAQAPEPPAGPTLSAYDLFNYGVDLQNSGHSQEAADAYTQAIGKLRTLTDAYLNRGTSYQNLGEWDKAIADADFFIMRKPDSPDGYINRGTAYAGKGDYRLALFDYQQALARNPKPYVVRNLLYQRAKTYYLAGEYRKSLSDWDEYLSGERSDTDLIRSPQIVELNRLACYLKMGQKATADETHRAQLGIVIRGCGQLLKPNVPDDVQNEASLLRAEAYNLMGETGAALEDVNRVIAARPKDADGYLLRARIYDTAGRAAEAEADRKRAAELRQ